MPETSTDTSLPGPGIWHYGCVSSSLDVADRLAGNGHLQPWDSVYVDQQTMGRGQMRRQWASPAGNIYATIRLPETPFFQAQPASQIMGLLILMACERLGLPLLLKWPNDLIRMTVDGPAKLGGILLEERNHVLLAGIGVNYTSHPGTELLREAAALPACDLSDRLGRTAQGSGGDAEEGPAPEMSPGRDPEKSDLHSPLPEDPETFWKILVSSIHAICTGQAGLFRSPETRRENGEVSWHVVYERHLLWRNEEVLVDDHSERLRGRLLGIDAHGALRIRVGDEILALTSGSISPVRY